jgi:hypothetical protein
MDVENETTADHALPFLLNRILKCEICHTLLRVNDVELEPYKTERVAIHSNFMIIYQCIRHY